MYLKDKINDILESNRNESELREYAAKEIIDAVIQYMPDTVFIFKDDGKESNIESSGYNRAIRYVTSMLIQERDS